MKTIPPGIDVPTLLRTEAELLEQLAVIQKIKSFLGIQDDAREAPKHSPGSEANRRSLRPQPAGSGKRPTWLDDIIDILREHGAPMHWKDIYVALEARRPGTGGKQPGATMRSSVRRANEHGDMRVVPVGGGTGEFTLSNWSGSEMQDASQAGEAQQAFPDSVTDEPASIG